MNAMIVIVGALACLGALAVVLSPQTIYSALSLVVTVGLLAVLFLLLNAQFLFAVQLIVYAGAVMVLFVFIIALLDPSSEDRPAFRDPRFIVGVIAIVGLTATVVLAARNGVTYALSCHSTTSYCMHAEAVGGAGQGPKADPYSSVGTFLADEVNTNGNTQTVGIQLFTVFLLPFEITSLLLLVSAIGAVYLTRRVPQSNPRSEASSGGRDRIQAQATADLAEPLAPAGSAT